ncbi:lipopolysaccharide kinase InaA family protein [Methylophaga sp.]|uniref:lipopolysaccharide kinase InaA family protein n=1 Tax=Methylophaga sp. TaxID=2024840 RepID=UPI003F696A57
MTRQPPKHKTKKNVPAVMNGGLLFKALKQVFKGGLSFHGGHIPPSGHDVATDFSGVGVAAAADPAADEYILDKLQDLGVRNVRIDVSYDDLDGPTGRLLHKLLNTNLQVFIHLVQPFDAAFVMQDEAAQTAWREFVKAVCERFGSRAYAIEVGSTINRRRWAGYSTKGFFIAWDIAHEEIKSRGITLAGPNISDFEPFYTFSILEELQQLAMLPDIHTNNLFCERVTEPERYDHRILGFQWATRLKVNLVKKARLLGKAGTNNGVSRFVSPAAFWTLPRIERLLAEKEQKQADYLTRYFVLLAASGALEKTFWGPLLCWREGLIDDGSGEYPELERITLYQSVTGKQEDFRPRAAFFALKQFNAAIPGSQYLGPLLTSNDVEVHMFRKNKTLLHVAWTINGKACPIDALYHPRDLQMAGFKNRDGENYAEAPEYITETPTYLFWHATNVIGLKPSAEKARLESVFAHRQHGQYHPVNKNGWRGMLIADNQAEAQSLLNHLLPDNLPDPTESTTLRKARNIIWTVPGLNGSSVVAKKPIKMHPHKRLLDMFKPSKSRRSWIAAAELSRRGIPTAQPLAFFEKENDRSMMQNLFVCEHVPHDFSAREMIVAFHNGANEFSGIKAEDAYRQLAKFFLRMHEHGVFFRDLAGGNILIEKQADGKLEFTLIDINRARFYNRSTPLKQRISDLTRICHKLHWEGREFLVEYYLQGMLKRKHFTLRYRLPFYLYDFKVNFKRRYGRKAIKKTWRKFRNKD